MPFFASACSSRNILDLLAVALSLDSFRDPRSRFQFAAMIDPPIPSIPSAVGIRDHDLRRAVGQVVPVAVSTAGPVRVVEGFAVACAHGVSFWSRIRLPLTSYRLRLISRTVSITSLA